VKLARHLEPLHKDGHVWVAEELYFQAWAIGGGFQERR